jgi:inosine triphosphate pyrophosphatase
MKDFVFVSGNQQKVEWLEEFLGEKVEHHKLDLIEIQSLDPQEVVGLKVREAYKKLSKAVLIDDVSLSFNALGRLPGTFIKYFLDEVGNKGICRLLDGYDDRSAVATVTYGYYDGHDFKAFATESKGEISQEPRGSFGHGWDPIFIPEGESKTHSEMNLEEYATVHPRNLAVKKLAEFLNS